MKKVLLLFITFLLIFSSPAINNAAAQTVTVRGSFDPASASPQVGSDFTVKVRVNPSTPITIQLFELKLNFDRSKLQVKQISYSVGQRSSNLNGDGDTTLSAVNSSGLIHLAGEIVSPPEGLSLSATDRELAQITFTATSASQSIVTIDGGFSNLTRVRSDFVLEFVSVSDATLSVNGGTATPTPTPTLGPTATPVPGALACSDFSPVGLTDTGDRGSAGEKIFAIGSAGGNRNLQVSRTPGSAEIAQPASTRIKGSGNNVQFSLQTGGSGNFVANIPANTTTTDNEYSITTIVSQDTRSANCPTFILRVAKTSVVGATQTVRIAENRGDLDRAGSYSEFPYSDDPLNIQYTLRDITTPGVRQLWVKFIGTDTSGQPTASTPLGPFPITVLGLAPDISSISCNVALTGGVSFEVKGANFGSTKGTRGGIKAGDSALRVDKWSDGLINATLAQAATDGQSFRVVLTRNDGEVTNEVTCTVGVSQIQLGANLFCSQAQAAANVEAILAEGKSGGTASKQTVTISSNGTVGGLKDVQEGQGYKLGVKAPKSLRRVVEFIAEKGTTEVNLTNLPVGDIFPAAGDGKINSADYSELLREWIIASAGGERSGDLNSDGRVNSFDWACMRPYFNLQDDSKPTAGPLTTIRPSPTPLPEVSPSPSPSPTPTASP